MWFKGTALVCVCMGTKHCGWHAELDVDLRWAGEPDIVLKLEPTNKWVMNALRLGTCCPSCL